MKSSWPNCEVKNQVFFTFSLLHLVQRFPYKFSEVRFWQAKNPLGRCNPPLRLSQAEVRPVWSDEFFHKADQEDVWSKNCREIRLIYINIQKICTLTFLLKVL